MSISVDANFKQKAHARANDAPDPALGLGFGCFVPHEEYINIVKDHQQSEISHCIGFNAIWKANNKKSKGLRATGIGERYCNMDTILLFSIMTCFLLLLYISYNIACQWYKNFRTHMAAMPEYLQIPSSTMLHFKVPKFHLPAHIPSCFAPFSFNFTKGVGKTDREAIERNWLNLNSIAQCVSMMTAGDSQPINFIPEEVVTVSQVKKQIAEEDYKQEVKEKGSNHSPASAMIIEGLEILETFYSNYSSHSKAYQISTNESAELTNDTAEPNLMKLAGVSEEKIKELLSGYGENIITVDEAPNLLLKRQPPSWIWYIGVIGNPDNIKAIEASLCVEWCKAHARADQSQEELELLEEEMCQAIDFCIWRAQWWKDQVGCQQGISRHLAEGLRAYAMEQSELEMIRATTWSATWSPIRQRLATIMNALREDHDLDAMLQQLGTLTVELDLDVEDDIQEVDEDID
ncbi:hypothetical protein Moror_10169 [Moniliophthora roreri MCA 2997]|uniref:Uncharacterized protein n=1 Tax=Moniliophthora roreri (strain MCA 2997) TaxID=1381753 RepID=V2WW06_MONRO|nr:hypothetical protein Moror_10169 [Moniliophthora roreri MCA 2997]